MKGQGEGKDPQGPGNRYRYAAAENLKLGEDDADGYQGKEGEEKTEKKERED